MLREEQGKGKTGKPKRLCYPTIEPQPGVG